MLNFIIYEDMKSYMQKNVDGINRALAKNDIEYRTHKFDHYCDELLKLIDDKTLKKIYILDVEMNGVSGLEVASKIRENDWDSIIIFATAYDKYHDDIFYNRLMVLDFICKYTGYERRLIDDVRAALDIIYKQKTFVFKYKNVIYRLPYSNICYIEKEPLIKRCTIHTINNRFYVVNSINKINNELGSEFLKTHQSCIVNLNNVRKLDLATNTLIFKNGISTSLLTEKMKKEVKKHVEFN